VREIDQFAGDFAVDAGDMNVEAGAEDEAVSAAVQQFDRRVGFGRCGERDLALSGREFERADEAGRPCGSEEIFGGGVRLRQRDVEDAVGAAGVAVGAAFDVGGAGEEDLSVMSGSFRVGLIVSV
jgi:hypothetical protein